MGTGSPFLFARFANSMQKPFASLSHDGAADKNWHGRRKTE
jgi:hypothetical protein